ncbi:MAG: tRNA dihydrouridine(20/20a) synthase DusA [Gammaproteobacteria bacterium RIFCSPHIGHO2_12_FULL_45_9]|nr:MAG: tRNA dihydrouridine(20/20a) synthase DusA [Gammaproteobacteria bacterium RIFCSPHIGHO2_12_FULL_45_9]
MFDRRISVAPMMKCTDQFDRYFLRLIAPHVVLYTEMVVANALAHRDPARWLSFHPSEHPVALQLGGCDPSLLAAGAKVGEDYGYDEVNLNVGCPSHRVSSGRFGACLMFEPQLVAESVHAMQSAVKIPVTVKCRIGVDQQDSYSSLCQFIETVSLAGCQTFIIHARKAWLSGLNPKANRTIPPLQYDVVHQVKRDYPQLTIIINGGVTTLSQVESHLPYVDGVMLGRAAYSNPYFLAEIEAKIFATSGIRSREEVVESFLPYAQEQLNKKVKLGRLTRHILGLFHGQSGALRWRRYLSEQSHYEAAGIEVIQQALSLAVG